MSEPIYDALLAQFIRKHGHKPGDRPTKYPISASALRRVLSGARP